MASHPIYEFYAELEDYEPKIWRRFQVMENVSMAKLGYLVMTMFEMQASHLFQIVVPAGQNYLKRQEHKKAQADINGWDKIRKEVAEELGTCIYDIPRQSEDDFPDPPHYHRLDATQEKLKHAVSEPGDELCLEYDFGDGWGVHLTLEKVFTDKELPGKELPRVLEGEGYGIIEDCGGPGGLENLAIAFKKRQGEEYETLSRWLGQTELDLEIFDLDDMNFRIKKVPRIYRELYELELEPTDYSQSILDREYKGKK